MKYPLNLDCTGRGLGGTEGDAIAVPIGPAQLEFQESSQAFVVLFQPAETEAIQRPDQRRIAASGLPNHCDLISMSAKPDQ